MPYYKDVDTTFYFDNLGDKDFVTIVRLTGDDGQMETANIRVRSILAAAEEIMRTRVERSSKDILKKLQTKLPF